MISPETLPQHTQVWQAPQGFLRDAGIGVFSDTPDNPGGGINMCPTSPYYECLVSHDPQDSTKLVITILGKQTNNAFVSLNADKFCHEITPQSVDNCIQHVIIQWDGTSGKDDSMQFLGADAETNSPVRDMYPVVDCPAGSMESLCIADGEIYNSAPDAPRIPLSEFTADLDNSSTWQGKVDTHKLAEQASVLAAKVSLLAGAFFFVRQWFRDKLPQSATVKVRKPVRKGMR